VKVTRREPVALDEPGRSPVAFRSNLRLVRKLEIDPSETGREVVDECRRMPRVGGQALVAGAQISVLVIEQKAALDQVADGRRRLDVDPLSLWYREERLQATLVQR
jgi:hypothetical protein